MKAERPRPAESSPFFFNFLRLFNIDGQGRSGEGGENEKKNKATPTKHTDTHKLLIQQQHYTHGVTQNYRQHKYTHTTL